MPMHAVHSSLVQRDATPQVDRLHRAAETLAVAFCDHMRAIQATPDEGTSILMTTVLRILALLVQDDLDDLLMLWRQLSLAIEDNLMEHRHNAAP